MTGHTVTVHEWWTSSGMSVRGIRLRCSCGWTRDIKAWSIPDAPTIERLVALQGEHYVAVLTEASTPDQQPTEDGAHP